MQPILPYYSGDKYNYLTLTGKSYCKPYPTCSIRYVECICVCGKIFFTLFYKVKSGGTKSCGCKRMEFIVAGNTKHGMTLNGKINPVYRTWLAIRQRCYNPKTPRYKSYGGRGISVCSEWLESFDSFYVWAMAAGWQTGLSIDRFPDNDGNYEPSNCRWATGNQQNRNKSNNINITAFGKTMCITDWSKDEICAGISLNALKCRIEKLGWSPEEAIITPPNERRKIIGNDF